MSVLGRLPSFSGDSIVGSLAWAIPPRPLFWGTMPAEIRVEHHVL